MHKLVLFDVIHTRHAPKHYSFAHKFFWFKLDLNSLDTFPDKYFSINKKGIYSFFDIDHMNLGGQTAKDNFIAFAKEKGLSSDVKNIWLYSQVRFLGYVFNPVSFVLIEDVSGKLHSIIEIGNTFNELKPFFVHNDHFSEKGFEFSTIKHFYISPFIAHDNTMTFKFSKDNDDIRIGIKDFSSSECTLSIGFKGKEIEASNTNLFKVTSKIPFVTLKIIFLIHYHALRLWLKGIRYYKKSEFTELQKGMMTWKTSKKK